jgi:hypothetical protein
MDPTKPDPKNLPPEPEPDSFLEPDGAIHPAGTQFGGADAEELKPLWDAKPDAADGG